MYNKIISDPSFYQILFEIDEEIAKSIHEKPCVHCGGEVDSAAYQRKPRGLPEGVSSDISKRFSFCCRVDGCRKRVTPPSVRFAGRRVWLSSVILVLSGSSNKTRRAEMAKVLDVNPLTIRRWIKWFKMNFFASSFWLQARGKLIGDTGSWTTIDPILSCFKNQKSDSETSFKKCLEFLKECW